MFAGAIDCLVPSSIVDREPVIPQSNPPRLNKVPYLNGKTGSDWKAFVSMVLRYKGQSQIYLSINITPFESSAIIISYYCSIVGINHYS